MRLRLVTALIAMLVANPCAAQRQPSYLATISGTCSEMVIAGEDRSGDCPATLFNMAYVDNTSSFRLIAESGIVISFFGDDNEAVGDRATLDVRTIYFTPAVEQREGETFAEMTARAAASTRELSATGRCEYTNPERPDNYVRCQATADGKSYGFRFSVSGYRITDMGGGPRK